MMDRYRFARELLNADSEQRADLLRGYADLCDSEIGKHFQEVCYEVWTSEPTKVSEIVEILEEILASSGDEGLVPYVEWTRGIEHLVGGRLEDCLAILERSESSFKALGRNLDAAKTRPAKIYALALLGRYDEAVECGIAAREVFLAEDDLYSAGKIEHNIGNLFWRRDRYQESEPFLASSHDRFSRIGDQRQLAMVENCQAFVKALQNEFVDAEEIYSRAIERTRANGLTVTQAEIEVGLSNLYLFQGRLDNALKFLESARKKYDLLGMPIQSANCLLEIADIYVELNLLPEAAGFYLEVESDFAELGMQAELARSLISHARVAFLMGETERSLEYLERAKAACESEGNRISGASVRLLRAQILLQRGEPGTAETEAKEALNIFANGGNFRQELTARWLCGEIAAKNDRIPEAIGIHEETLECAKGQSRQVEYLCLVSLGVLTGREEFFLEAVEQAEGSRAELGAKEFRRAFFSDKLVPFNELTKIRLSQGRTADAFLWHERSRSRSLFESIEADPGARLHNGKLDKLGRRLNWFYNRINRQDESGLAARNEILDLRKQAEKIEREYAETSRRLEVAGELPTQGPTTVDPDDLREHLRDTALIEFVRLDSKFSAFVITEDDLQFIDLGAEEEAVRREVAQILFQIKTARFADRLSDASRATACSRMLRHSQNVFQMLMAPIKEIVGSRRLKIVPSDVLFYLPFQALHNGERFLVETNEISYAPSASIFKVLASRDPVSFENGLLIGVTGKSTPRVSEEIEKLGKLFGNSVLLRDDEATFANVSEGLKGAHFVHFACHGHFRPDSPEFSALSLFEENLAVKDIQRLQFENKFVTLSACETGLNRIVPGEELAGLTEGFISAGASALLLSLWSVNDEATLRLMENFYSVVGEGVDPSKALQRAQLASLYEDLPPYFWAPFVLIGR